MDLPWILCVILLVAVIILSIKVNMLHKGIKEISQEFNRFLSEDTNVLISVSSDDKYVVELARKINVQLSMLRKQRLQYINGDKELKEAVTNISHDLRTPLTAIWGYLDLLESEDKSGNVSRYVSQIRERSEVLKQLTEELFAYSIIASVPDLNYEEVNVNRILEETMVSFYEEMKAAGLQVTVNISENTVYRRLDVSALVRVFNNIISNAIKYSDVDLCVVMYDDGKIVFSNTAKQLSSVEVKKLFDRFFTVNSARKSTGLGLSIAKLLVERMNGDICADYEENRLYITVTFK